MRRARLALPVLLCCALTCISACGSPGSGAPGTIVLVVEQRLAEPLTSSIEQLAGDLRAEGFEVRVDDTMHASAPPAEIRAALLREWRAARRLEGAMLIGEFGAPLFNRRGSEGDPYWHDHLVDLYYMDVDGAWTDSTGDGILDRHDSFAGNVFWKALSRLAARVPLGLDRRAPEFWVSRIRAGTLEPLGEELALYRDYFERNHAYRTRNVPAVPPRAFILSASARFSTSGWGARPEKLYTDVTVTECTQRSSASLREYLGDPRGWALGVIGSFSGPQAHKFHSYEGGGFDESWFRTREGRQQIADYSLLEHEPWDVTSREVASLRPNVLFYQVLSSETGRHDQTGYLGGAYLFYGSGLAVIAGTQHSGAIGVPMLYDELAAGSSIGAAWRSALEWSLGERSVTQHWCDGDQEADPSVDVYKAVLLGDGTLRLPVAVAGRE